MMFWRKISLFLLFDVGHEHHWQGEFHGAVDNAGALGLITYF
jgi:hypothetical protein